MGNRFVERKAVVVRIYVGADPVLRTEEKDTSCKMDHSREA